MPGKPNNPALIHHPFPSHETTAANFTLRDLFVAAVTAGMQANSAIDQLSPDEFAHDAGKIADAMLRERAK